MDLKYANEMEPHYKTWPKHFLICWFHCIYDLHNPYCKQSVGHERQPLFSPTTYSWEQVFCRVAVEGLWQNLISFRCFISWSIVFAISVYVIKLRLHPISTKSFFLRNNISSNDMGINCIFMLDCKICLILANVFCNGSCLWFILIIQECAKKIRFNKPNLFFIFRFPIRCISRRCRRLHLGSRVVTPSKDHPPTVPNHPPSWGWTNRDPTCHSLLPWWHHLHL